jgi:hypothetical protein
VELCVGGPYQLEPHTTAATSCGVPLYISRVPRSSSSREARRFCTLSTDHKTGSHPPPHTHTHTHTHTHRDTEVSEGQRELHCLIMCIVVTLLSRHGWRKVFSTDFMQCKSSICLPFRPLTAHTLPQTGVRRTCAT